MVFPPFALLPDPPAPTVNDITSPGVTAKLFLKPIAPPPPPEDIVPAAPPANPAAPPAIDITPILVTPEGTVNVPAPAVVYACVPEIISRLVSVTATCMYTDG